MQILMLFFVLCSISTILEARPLPNYNNGLYVGNGGGQIYCREYDNQYNLIKEEFFMLDYAVISQQKAESELRFANSYEPIEISLWDLLANFEKLPYSKLNKIEMEMVKMLKSKSPNLANDLRYFLESSLNTSQNTLISWKSSSTIPLVSSNNPDLITGCKLTQAVLRARNGDHLFFDYNINLIFGLNNYPLQKSFMMIHEWLWKYSSSAENIANINWFLHSKAAINLSASDFMKKLQQLGFILNYEEPDSEYNDTPRIIKNIVKTCKNGFLKRITSCNIFENYEIDSKKEPIIQSVKIIESNSRCHEGTTWGVNGLNPEFSESRWAKIWTSNSCKGKFKVTYTIVQ